MKAIILAAGYGVRLEEDLRRMKETNKELYLEIRSSIEGRAKPMVLLAGRPLIEHIVSNIEKIKEVDRIIIVTNSKFFSQFNNWYLEYKSSKKIILLDDGTYLNEDRIGAVGDLIFALNEEKIDDDLLVFAGDNLFKFELNEMVELFHKKKSDVIAVYPEDSRRIKRSACVMLDKDNKVIDFEEKPEKPKTNLACPAVYVYKKSTVSLIKKMELDTTKRDLIGNIPMTLYKEIPFYALKKDAKIRFDLGTVEDFKDAEIYLENKNKG